MLRSQRICDIDGKDRQRGWHVSLLSRGHVYGGAELCVCAELGFQRGCMHIRKTPNRRW